MTTAILDRASYEQVSRQAREIRTGYAILFVIAKFFFLIGWLFGRIVPCLMWCALSVKKGYHASYGPSKNMKIAALTARVEELQKEVGRYTNITPFTG